MTEAGFDLGQFLPKKDLGAKIEIRKELAPVVERISKIIPPPSFMVNVCQPS